MAQPLYQLRFSRASLILAAREPALRGGGDRGS